jgi:iron complex outermembrane recepter protein
MRQIDFGRNLDLPAGAPTTWAAVDYDKIQQAVPYLSQTGDFRHNLGADTPRTVEEEVTAYFVQADFNFDLADIHFRGDLGVRYAETETLSGGITTFTGTRVFSVFPFNYNDTLPSLNLAAELTDDFIVRFAAAKTLTRPEYGLTAPGLSATNFTTTFQVTIGNPTLEPIRANTYDLQAEWYFDEGALLSVGLFYKDIDSYIQGQAENVPFSDTGLPTSLLRTTANCYFTGEAVTAAGPCPASPATVFRVTRNLNTPGGPLQGYEINYQQPFTFLPGFWSNFGVLANYTWVESDITYYTLPAADNPATPIDERGPIQAGLLELSPSAYNATLYYEDDRLSARISAAYRDAFLTQVLGASSGNDVGGTDENLFIDSSATYTINDRLKLTFEALNLTDEFQRFYRDSERNDTLYYNHSGRTYSVGFNYRF